MDEWIFVWIRWSTQNNSQRPKAISPIQRPTHRNSYTTHSHFGWQIITFWVNTVISYKKTQTLRNTVLLKLLYPQPYLSHINWYLRKNLFHAILRDLDFYANYFNCMGLSGISLNWKKLFTLNELTHTKIKYQR